MGGFADVSVKSRILRLGGHVVVEGMQGSQTRLLNGFAGVISEHPREGHPTFVRKSSAPDRPQLTVCVVFDNPRSAGGRSVVLEPRFLVPYSEAFHSVSRSLGDMLASLQLAAHS